MKGQTDIAGLEAALSRGAVLIDVRERDEYAAGHVPGAASVPMGLLPGQLDHLRGLGAIHLICRTGARSAALADVLALAGLEVVDVPGGTVAWVESGRELEGGLR